MNLSWIKCSGDQWCQLSTVNLLHSYFDGLEGVYIIWHGQPNPAVVYVGQGLIRDKITQRRQDTRISAYQAQGLYITWAKVDSIYQNGIENFLVNVWKPKINDDHPTVPSIEVNSPWPPSGT